jgi:succinate-acetate transporter protein
MMVCGLFCVFWLSFGLLQLPTLGLATAYSATGNAAEGMVSKEMNAVIALYLLVWGFALGTFWLFTIRINAVFAGIFGFVTIGSWVLSGAYWALSDGKFDKALKLQKVRHREPPRDRAKLQQAGGALLFIVAMLGWYMLFVIMAAEMRWSVNLPVGDLSHYWRKTDVELAAMENEKRD